MEQAMPARPRRSNVTVDSHVRRQQSQNSPETVPFDPRVRSVRKQQSLLYIYRQYISIEKSHPLTGASHTRFTHALNQVPIVNTQTNTTTQHTQPFYSYNGHSTSYTLLTHCLPLLASMRTRRRAPQPHTALPRALDAHRLTELRRAARAARKHAEPRAEPHIGRT